MARGGGGKIIIVKRVKKGGHPHHGGSWKVAYADFVTAMMAFFMVMWILGMDEDVKKAIEGYFSNPVGVKKGFAAGSNPLMSGSAPSTVRREAVQVALRQMQQQRFKAVESQLRGKLDSVAASGKLKARVEVMVSAAGLRIELIEDGDGDTFFPFASSEMKEAGKVALLVIAEELRTLQNPVVIEGHTDAAQYARRDFTNWELSADRANSARRVLETSGLGTDRIVEVNGLADKQLHYPKDPLNPANRRISILLPFLNAPDAPSVELLKEKIQTGIRKS
jgi:chemotaxis protein MotB